MSVQDKIHRILWDRRYINAPEGVDHPDGAQTVLLCDAVLSDRNYYLHIREHEEQKCVRDGLSTEDEIFEKARLSDYWTEDDDLVLSKFDEHVDYLNRELERKGFAARKKQIKAAIQEANLKKQEVEAKQAQLKSNTAEYHAHSVASNALLRLLVRRMDGTLFWETEESFVLDRNLYPVYIQFLLNEMLQEGMWKISEIREVARSVEWRLSWTLARENLSSLFNRPVGDLNLNQRLLIYWSRVYDTAFEDPKPPEMEVINDDERFDDWLANREKDRKEEAAVDKRKITPSHHQEQMVILDGEYCEDCSCGVGDQRGVGLGRKKRHADSCQYGVFREYTQAEKDAIAQTVYGRNAGPIRKYMNREHDAVAHHGTLKEQQLRGSKKAKQLLGINEKVTVKYIK